MLFYLLDIIPKIQAHSKKLDDTSLLTNHHWVCVDNVGQKKTVFIFRDNEQLLISENGKVVRGRWEYIGSQSLLIEINSEILLFRHGFLDECILALKVDGTETYALFINETKYGTEVNDREKVSSFLESKYIKNKSLEISETTIPTHSLTEKTNNRSYINDSVNFAKVTSNSMENKAGTARLEDGRELVFYANNANIKYIIEGCFVLLNAKSKPDDGIYKSKDLKRYEISNGILVNEFKIEKHTLQNGESIEIDIHRMQTSRKGSRVWLHNHPAPNGIYKIGAFNKITVKNGAIV